MADTASGPQEPKKGNACGKAIADCRNSRSGAEWRKLIIAYLCFYLFLAAWMASLMTIYMQTRPPVCTWRNGENFCIGEPRTTYLLDARISIPAAEVGSVRTCGTTTLAADCSATTNIKLNNLYALRQLPADFTITCVPQAISDEGLEKVDVVPTSISCEAIPSAINEEVVEAGGLIDQRDCTVVANTVSLNFRKGALMPLAMQFTSKYPNILAVDDDGEFQGIFTCTANSTDASIMDRFTIGRYQSSQIEVINKFGPKAVKGNDGPEVSEDIV